MALTIEDGTRVAGANSYASLAEARSYATARGQTLSADDAIAESLLIQAMDYIESHRGRFQGWKVSADQALQWPRAGVYLDGYALTDDVIPIELKDAQCQLALDANNTELMPTGDGRELIRQSVAGVIDKQWAQSGDSNPQPHLTKADSLLRPLLDSKSGFLEVHRV